MITGAGGWLAVELSEGRKAAIMPITINPHPVDETPDIPSIPELRAKLELAVDCYRALTHSRHRGEVARSVVVAADSRDEAALIAAQMASCQGVCTGVHDRI